MMQPRLPVWLLATLLALATIALYWPATSHDFVNFDDDRYVTDNPRVQAGLSWEGVKSAFVDPVCSNWQPLTVLSHMLVCQAVGLKAAGHHLANVLLHALNAMLVFALLQQMTGARWRSLLAAALFAVHPLRAESVAWVAELKDVLSGCFGLLALWSYARYVQVRSAECGVRSTGKAKGDAGKAKGLRLNAKVGHETVSATLNSQPSTLSPVEKAKGLRLKAKVSSPAEDVSRFSFQLSAFSFHASAFYLLSLTFFALGLMSKPTLVAWPFIMLLLDYWPLGRFAAATPNSQLATAWRLVREKIPFLALAAAASVITFLVQKVGGSLVVNEGLSLSARGGNALISYCRHLQKMFWPTNLAVFYPHPGHWPLEQVLLAGAFLLGTSVLLFVRRRQSPYLLVGWLWFVGMLVPMIGLVQTGGQALADRHTYLASLGLLILAVWGAHELSQRWHYGAVAFSVAGCAAIVLCMVSTRQQLGYWKNSETLFARALQVTQNNYIAHNNLGNALYQKGRIDEAITHYQETLRLQPDYALAHNNLGTALYQKGQTDEAIAHYQETLRLNPNYALAHQNLGNALYQKGQIDEAIRQFQEGLRLKPNQAEAHYSFGTILGKAGQTQPAIDEFQEALRLKPGFYQAHLALAQTLPRVGRLKDAAFQMEEFLRTCPGTDLAAPGNSLRELALSTLNDLAWLLATSPQAEDRDGGRAVRFAERACDMTQYQQTIMVGTLAAAYAETGRFPEAVATAQKAINLATQEGDPALLARNRELLDLYRAEKPFHEPAVKKMAE
jgi:protein O-mannosyl-transferase